MNLSNMAHNGWMRFALLFLVPLAFAGCSDSHSSTDGSVGDADPCADGACVDTGVPPATYDSCDVPSDCVLTANTCCGVCGAPTRSDVAAVNADMTMDYYLDVACPAARTAPPPCPDCAGMPNPNLIVTCIDSRCRVVDLASDPPYAECTADSDCIVRARDCCECGADLSPFNLVAIAASELSSFEGLVCDPMSACPECAPVYPTDIGAACNDGFCALAMMMSMP